MLVWCDVQKIFVVSLISLVIAGCFDKFLRHHSVIWFLNHNVARFKMLKICKQNNNSSQDNTVNCKNAILAEKKFVKNLAQTQDSNIN